MLLYVAYQFSCGLCLEMFFIVFLHLLFSFLLSLEHAGYIADWESITCGFIRCTIQSTFFVLVLDTEHCYPNTIQVLVFLCNNRPTFFTTKLVINICLIAFLAFFLLSIQHLISILEFSLMSQYFCPYP